MRQLLIVAITVVSACAQTELPTNARKAAAQGYSGKADGSGDVADTSCLLVLRSVGGVPGPTGGLATSCDMGISSSRCSYVWEGFVDVDNSRLPQAVEVLYRTTMTGDQWYAVTASEVGEGEKGFRRYRFLISEYTPVPGMSTTSLMRTVIELIPYAVTPTGGRIFDHNRIQDPLGSYRLDQTNNWRFDPDQTCQPHLDVPEYRFTYSPWEQRLVGGPVVAGGQVKVVYDVQRLLSSNKCMGGKAASAGTTFYVGWKFDNSEDIGQAVVGTRTEYYGYLCHSGSTCVESTSSQPVIDIPKDARRVEFWFYCVPYFAGGPTAYDSNYGQNYALEVSGAKDFWAGNFVVKISREDSDPCEGGTPYADSYTYDSWARVRATVKNFCFEVWQPGVTDQPESDIPNKLDVKVHYYYAGQEQQSSAYVNMVYRTGNNARYALNVGAADPFAIYHCPDVPYTPFERDGMTYWQADYYFYFTVNGHEVRPAGPDSLFHGIYIGENTPWHEENCH